MKKLNRKQLDQIVQGARDNDERPCLNDLDISKFKLPRIDFEDVDLCRANLSGTDLQMANLRNTNLRGANLHGAILFKADMQWAILSGAKLNRADLRHANLRGIVIDSETQMDRKWRKVWEIVNELKKAQKDLRSVDMSDADLRGCNLAGVILSGANLSYANLEYADLSNAHLNTADLRGCKLMGANLCGADLRHAKLVRADLTGVDFNYRTEWPDGFDNSRTKQGEEQSLGSKWGRRWKRRSWTRVLEQRSSLIENTDEDYLNEVLASQRERTEKHIDRRDWDGTFISSPLKDEFDDESNADVDEYEW